MSKKKLVAILTLLCFMFTLMPVAAMADTTDRVVLKIGSTDVYKNGTKITTDVPPVIVDGRTLVPVRVVIEALGGDIDWDETTRTVIISIDGKVLKLVIDKEIPGYGTGAMIVDGRTMVPIRYISEYVGYEVKWIEATQQVIITRITGEAETTYTVSFDLNTGSEGVYKTVTVEEGQTVAKPEVEYKSGRVFHGWYTNDEGKGEPFDFSTPIYSDITLYGHWSYVSYGGGGSSAPSHTHVYGDEWEANADGTHSKACDCGVTQTADCEYGTDSGEEHVCKECGGVEPTWAVCDGPLVADSSWYDESKNELEITTPGQLLYLSELVDNGNTLEGKTVKLGQNIDLYCEDENGEVISFEPIGSYRNDTPFKGIFDGQNYTIQNLSQNTWALDTGYYYGDLGLGLFGLVEDATIKNLNMDNASISGESAICGTVAATAYGDSVFENITVTNSEVADYQYYAGGIVGWASGNHQYINCDVDASTTIAAQWGDFDNSTGGVIGGVGTSAAVHFKDCDVACRIDAYNDVTSSYQWYAYRRCGMLIGNPGATKDVNGTTYAAAPQLTCENVTVTYGDWADYTYCEFAGTSWPYVRVQAGISNSAYSNPRYGHPTDANGNQVVDDNHVHNPGEDHFILCAFNQLYGGGQGVYGTATHDGVTVIGRSIEKDAEVTIDLQGDARTGAVVNEGDVTIKNGTIVNNAVGVENYGKAEINDVTMNAGSAGDYAVISGSDSETILTDVDVNSAGGGIGATDGAKVTFNSGSVDVSSASTSGRYNFYVVGEGTEVTINDGEFSFSKTLNQKRAYIYVGEGATVYVNGGEFGPASTRSGYTAGILGNGTVIITGGTFGFDPSNWVADGYEAVKTGTTWTVSPK